MDNILDIKTKEDFYNWLLINSQTSKECYIELTRGCPKDDGKFYYLDAVEVALCFGWIDSTLKVINGKHYQRFTKRSKQTVWSELNLARVRRLINLGLMTKDGFDTLPELTKKEIVIPKIIYDQLIENDCLNNFYAFPKLYQRIRIYNIMFYEKKDEKQFNTSLNNFIKNTKINKIYGQWNDYGRLSDDE